MKETKYAGTQTEKNLMAAFAGESEARNKYTYFASKAKKEGRLDTIQAPRRLFRLGLDIRTPEAFVGLRGNLGVPFV